MSPELRFPGFADNWKARQLGNVVTFKNGKPFEDAIDPKGSYDLITIDSVDIEGRLKDKFKKVSYSDNSLKKDDIVVVLSDIAHGYLLGLSSLIPSDNRFVLNQRVGRLRPINNDVPAFISQSMNTKQVFFRRRGQGTSQRHIYERDLAQLPIAMPSTPEQEKIAELMQLIDGKVTIADRKLSQLRNYKSGLVQKVFSPKSSLRKHIGTPTEWNTRKLTDVITPGSKIPVADTSKYKKITVGLDRKGIRFSDISRAMADTRPFYVRQEGEIIIGKQNYFSGSVAIVGKEFSGSICSNAIMSFKTKPGFSTKYIYEYIARDEFLRKREALANGTGQKELSEKDFLNFEIQVPGPTEQQRIADILTLMDDRIATQEMFVQYVKHFKKSLLQRMII